MDFTNNLHDALVERVIAVWPEVEPNGVHYFQDFAREQFDQWCERNQLPVAVIQYDLSGSTRWALSSRSEEGPVQIYYVAPPTLGTRGLETKLRALATSLDDVPLSSGQVIGTPWANQSPHLDLNRHLLNAARSCYVGCVMLDALAGETR